VITAFPGATEVIRKSVTFGTAGPAATVATAVFDDTAVYGPALPDSTMPT